MSAVSMRQERGLGIIVVNYGAHNLIEDNVGKIGNRPGVIVVVVDNFTTDTERAAISSVAQKHDWMLISRPDNAGFGVAVNEGVERAIELGCQSFLLLNPDATLDVPTMDALWLHVDRHPQDVVVPRIMDSSGRTHFDGSYLDLKSGSIRGRLAYAALTSDGSGRRDWTSWLTAACLMISRQMWELVGGMDEGFFMYWEDVDLTVRCADAGATLVVRSDLTAIHDEGGTQDRPGQAKSNLYYLYNCRNRLRFAAKRLGRTRIIWWILATPRESWRILLRGGRRQLFHSPGPLGSAVQGTLMGLFDALTSVIIRPRSGQLRADV